MAALLKGRGFVTNGPLLEFSAVMDTAGTGWPGRPPALPGDEIRLPPGGGKIRLRAALRSIVPLDRLEIVANGRVIQSIPLGGDRRQADFEHAVEVRRSGWYTLQAMAGAAVHPIEDSRPMATTNPIYVYIGDQPIRSRESADYFVRWMDKLTRMAADHPGWRSEAEKRHVLAQFEEARQVYVRRAAQAR